LITSFDGFGGGSPDASTEGGDDTTAPSTDSAGADSETGTDTGAGSDAWADTADAASDASTDTADAGSDDSTDGDASAPEAQPPEGGCPVGAPGPPMVRVGTFCIDSTEITVRQYSEYLLAVGGTPGTQPAACAWNTSPAPQNFPPTGSIDQALNGVNWCQAYLYCAWAGKRLCGNPNGGPADPGMPNVPSNSQWYQACSRNDDGQHQYPYGNAYHPHDCNGAEYEAGAPLPSLSTCQGGYPGIFDMSGNVLEWEDSCQPDPTDPTGQNDTCNIRGGAFWSHSGQLTCALQNQTKRSDQGLMNDLGLRCCSK
jgi:formylglycine-generating enzyme required for sulfatase activity